MGGEISMQQDNYFDEVYSDTDSKVRSRQIGNNAPFKKWAIPLASCFLLLFIGLGTFFAVYQNRSLKENSYSDVKLFTDGTLLYFTDVGKDNKLFSYDPVAQKIKAVTDEAVYEFYVNDEYYFYCNKSGLYSQDRKTGAKYPILEYGKEPPERIKELDGKTLLDTPINEYCHDITEHQGSLFFVHDMSIDLKVDENTINGQENRVTLYRFDMEPKSLTKIKSDYHVSGIPVPPNPPKDSPDYDPDYTGFEHYKDISMNQLNIMDDGIYYRNGSGVHRLSMDGKDEKTVYASSGIAHIYWHETVFNCIENMESDLNSAVPIEDQEVGICCNAVNLKGEKTVCNKMTDEKTARLNPADIYYDSKTDSYLVLLNKKLIRFSFDNPQEYITVAEVDQKIQNINTYNIITVGKRIFISAYDGIARTPLKNNDYYIMTVDDDNDMIPIIKNGKIAS
ncbi:MAG: hypothetical protein ACOYJX_05585 [Acutalibacteraceae bacterium]|jgi:hypothetical protein